MSAGLRSARTARGWSQERLVREIEQFARRNLTDVASTASLRVYVSEWENGKRNISDRYARMLRQLLGVTDGELRDSDPAPVAPTADGYDDLLSRIDSASSVSESMVKMFNDQTELLRTMDRQRGAAALVDQMSGHLSALEDALNFAVLPSARRPVALALAGASTLAAWQGIVLALLGEESAVTSLYGALEVMDPTFVRARAGLHADLAQAHLTRAEYDNAGTHLRQARLLASRTGSVRQRRRVDMLTARL